MIIKNWSPSLTAKALSVRLSSCGKVLSSCVAGTKLFVKMATQKQAEKARELLLADPFSDLKVLLPKGPINCKDTSRPAKLI